MDDEDGKYLADTLRVLQQVEAWTARTSADSPRLRPSLGSELAEDDNQAQPYHVSHAVWHLLSNATDHLGCLHALLGDAKVIHMYAPFTLVRAALENACGAVWLLQPAERKDRLARRFRLAIDDVRNGEQARHLTGLLGPRSREERISEIRAIASRAGLGQAALKGGAAYSEIIKSVDASVPPGKVVEASWRLCSGFAHGDWWTTLSASQRTPLPGTAREGIGTFRIEANLSLLMMVTMLAVRTTRRGWQLHDQRCQPPY